jgi:transposase
MYNAAMHKPTRPRRDFEALEQRRKRAARLFASGSVQATVARMLDVSRQSVSRWYRQWKNGGASSLRGAGRAGRLPKLDAKQREQLDEALRLGARAHGFPTDLWTLPRVAKVIRQATGVRYHPGHVWRILRSMNWSLQRPTKRARERNEEGIQQWVSEKWPAVKKKPDAKKPGSSSKTRAGSRSGRRYDAPGRPREKRQS